MRYVRALVAGRGVLFPHHLFGLYFYFSLRLVSVDCCCCILPGASFDDVVQCACGSLGRASDRRSRRHSVDSVPAGSARDLQDDTCPGRRRAVSLAALRRRHLPPQPGQHDREAQTTRHGPRSRVNNERSIMSNAYILQQ